MSYHRLPGGLIRVSSIDENPFSVASLTALLPHAAEPSLQIDHRGSCSSAWRLRVLAASRPDHRLAIKIERHANANSRDPRQAPPGSEDHVISWVREYRRRHGRLPQIQQVQREFGTSRTTSWRRIKAA